MIRKPNRVENKILLITILLILSLFSLNHEIFYSETRDALSEPSKYINSVSKSCGIESSLPQKTYNGGLQISYIDVGQGDSIFIELPNGETILIDAGNPEDGQHVAQYIRDNGAEKLDYVIATHPHADHIGGLAEVIDAFTVENIYMPKATHTTASYEDLLQTIQAKGLKIETAKAGKKLFDDGRLQAEFLAPNSDSYSNLNNYSAVLMLTYGNNKFLFMGDAEAESEKEMLYAGFDLSADVLKVGHHGGSASTTDDFLEAVSPSVAVISVGADNSYGNPHADVLASLSERGADIWRTDEKGTVVVTSDGATVTLDQIFTSIQPGAPPDMGHQDVTVYITKSGTKYHRAGCRYLSKSSMPVSLETLDTEKYSPCSICKPPPK